MTTEDAPVKRGPGRPPKSISLVPAAPFDELPVVESVGWVKQARGWVVVHLKTQGDKVIEQEVLSEQSTLASAWERLRVSVITKLWEKASKR
jgi:hypothetical protein